MIDAACNRCEKNVFRVGEISGADPNCNVSVLQAAVLQTSHHAGARVSRDADAQQSDAGISFESISSASATIRTQGCQEAEVNFPLTGTRYLFGIKREVLEQ